MRHRSSPSLRQLPRLWPALLGWLVAISATSLPCRTPLLADEPQATSAAKAVDKAAEKKATEEEGAKEQPADWKPLFDGKSLAGWKSTNFGGEGEIEIKDGQLILHQGGPLTGVTWTKDFPKVDFEISLEAQRVEGTDFFVGLTFPVRDSHASLIVGGWAGSVVGISSIDGNDAVQNETTQVMKFDNGKWYKFRLRVTADRIKAWIDDKMVIDVNIQGRKITTRNEVNLSQPVGLATYETQAALRNLRYRVLKP